MSLRGVVFVVFLEQVAVVACSSYYSAFLLLPFVGLIILASANKLATKYLIDRVSERCVLCSRYFHRFLALASAVLSCLSACSYWLLIVLVRYRHIVITAVVVNRVLSVIAL
jgi:hypothetical protein